MMSKLYEENLKPSLKDIKANLNSGKHTMLLDAHNTQHYDYVDVEVDLYM